MPINAMRSNARKHPNVSFLIVFTLAYIAVVYPVMALSYELELANGGLLASWDPGRIMTTIFVVHWPSVLICNVLLLIPALLTRHFWAQTAAALVAVELAHRQQREFISVISHEFRTPLTAIQGFSELIRDEGLAPEQIKEFSNDINIDARRLARMIGEMLDLDRLESGRTEIHATSVDLASSAAAVIAEAKIISPEHRFVNRIGPLFVQADPDKLTQILTNLVHNATKYTPPGSTVTLSVACDRGMADIAVSDDGPGIPKEALPRLFERYYRVESEANVGIVGTGLGLAIVRETAGLLGGRAWAESDYGNGATFHFTLPVSAAPIAAAA